MDFPGYALSNFHVLRDFTDIAYAVCVVTNVATDGTQGDASPNLTQPSGPSTARLRKAEHEIRKMGILVSSDLVKQELLTFFRKTDLQREGKSIFSRLVAVLRSNTCTIADKKASRASDMLHPENGRLHRLFMAALLPSIRSVVLTVKELIPCGMATYIARSEIEENPERQYVYAGGQRTYRFLDLAVQLLASGHLLLSLRPDSSVHLSQPQVGMEASLNKSLDTCERLGGEPDRILILTPSVRVARLVSRQSSPVPELRAQQPRNRAEPGVQEFLQFETRKRELWEGMVESWLADQGIERGSWDRKTWLDLELPVRSFAQSAVAPETPKERNPGTPTVWQPIRWPASLCFELPEARPLTLAPKADEVGVKDPLSFAEDWFLGAEARAKFLEELRNSSLARLGLENQPTESESFPRNPPFANSPIFHRHTVGDVSMSNIVYPTPPDGPVSQVTPGMSSMDGVVATPADQNQHFPGASHTRDDEDMPDVVDAQDEDLAIGTGQYDEDLFGDIPVETFGPSGIADEPNWDFFDEPDLDVVADQMEHLTPYDAGNSHSPNTDSPQRPSDVLKNSKPSSVVGDQEDIELDGLQIEESSPANLQQMYLGSPRTENDLPDKDHKAKPPEFAISDQEEPPLTGSDVKHTVAHSMLLVRPASKTMAERNARLDPGMMNHSFVEVVHAGRGSHLSDDKYGASGRFWFGNANGTLKELPRQNSDLKLPKIGLSPFDSSFDVPHPPSHSMDKKMLDEARSESSSCADQSDFDSSGLWSTSNEPVTPSPDTNREWTKYLPAPPESPKGNFDPHNEQDIQDEFEQLLDYLSIDDAKAIPADYEQHSPESELVLMKGASPIVMAQILVDQLAQSSLKCSVFSLPETADVPPLDFDISKELGEAYGAADHVNLHQLARVSCASNDEEERISKLSDTEIRVYREGKPLTALSTILPFWDILGLQPASGQKNITAFCIHPHGSNVVDGCRAFIERLGETYENGNFGNHTTGRIAGTTNDGLVAWSATDTSLPDLLQTCERVGVALSRLPATDGNTVVYMIIPNNSECPLLAICEGFMAIWSTYVRTCGKKQPNELVLQLIPMNFVALPDTVAIPAQNEYLSLAIEVYNRCPPSDIGDKIACCGSAIVLAEPVRSQIHFDLSGTAQSLFEKNGRCMHLAYSQSNDGRWITAAWTDTLGHTALTMSYCLRQKGSHVARPVSDVIKDLWEISLDLMNRSSTKWRLIVGKEGRLAPTEANDWAVLANRGVADGHSSQHALVLLAINPDPSLSLRLPPYMLKQFQGGGTQQPSGLYGTPVSTPQASTTSPDQTTMATPTPGGTAINAPTPPEHSFDPNAETDLSLSDPIDGTWSVILSYGINQATSVLEARPALASGYLLKRRGVTDADNVVALEVNIVYTAVTSHSERHGMLKEILSQYKDLVTLAKTRGMVDPVACVLPWHVATAMKGQQALTLFM